MKARTTGARSRSSTAEGGRSGARRSARMQELQRTRLLSATIRAACEEGVASVTVSSVVSRAGISRRTFYEIFENSEECVIAAIGQAAGEARERAAHAWRAQQGPWRARVRAALIALLALFEERPQLADFLIVQWPAAGARALAQRRETLAELAKVIEQGREHAGRGAGPPQLAGEAVTGAVLGVLHTRLLDAGQDGRLLQLTNPLMSMIVMPYMGGAAARRELTRAAPQVQPGGEAVPVPESVLGELGLRLTVRTAAVIAALAAHPDASNRTIGQAAGIGDQGQVSKLLSRLHRLGLIENHRRGAPGKGQPNIWRLTETGRRLERSLRL